MPLKVQCLAGCWLLLILFAGCAQEPVLTDGAEVVEAGLWGATDDTMYPGTIAFGADLNPPSCSGTLIAPNVVLTAQHCVYDLPPSDPENPCQSFGSQRQGVYIIIGPSANLSGEIVAIDEVVRPDNCTNTCGCDMALARLRDNVSDPSIVIPPRIWVEPHRDEEFIAVGYGNTNAFSGYGRRRIRPEMKVLCAGKECGALDVLTEAEFGASSGPCSGDSGGPAISLDGEVMGVISRGGIPCDDPDTTSIYGTVSQHRDWIISFTKEASMKEGNAPPTWTTEPGPSVCDRAMVCGPKTEDDGSAVMCTCKPGFRCDFFGKCETDPNFDPDAPLPPPPAAGMTGGMDSAGTGAGMVAEPMGGAAGEPMAGMEGSMAGVGAAGMAPIAGATATMETKKKGKDDGCSVGGPISGSTPVLWLLALVAVRRRRR